jgi:ABC-type antimicrobial peptide transport system permease subunit
VAGVALFLLGGGLMRGMVYGVVTDDPLTIVAVAMVVVFVALGAVWRPAKMATRINPAAALRAD